MSESGKTIRVEHIDVEDPKIKKKNLWCYPLGTVGRDMVYNMFTSFIYRRDHRNHGGGPDL